MLDTRLLDMLVGMSVLECSTTGSEDLSVIIFLTINLRVDTLVLEDNKVEE